MILSDNFLEISEKYQFFIFDIWGVIHDGTELYPNTISTLEYLKKQNKKVCLLSNAPRRSFKAEELLKKFNIGDDLYEFILTSGEATYESFAEPNNFGKKYFYLGPQKDIDLLDGLDYEASNNVEECDFAVVTGFDDDDSTIDEKMDDLNRSLKANLTMVCVNPDMIVIKKTGKTLLCAGQIAKKYKELGGKVIYFGKPYPQVYKKVMERFSLRGNFNGQILAIGDGLETDIAGANRYGIDSVFVTSGIISATLGNKYSQLPDYNSLQHQCELHNAFPTYVISNL